MIWVLFQFCPPPLLRTQFRDNISGLIWLELGYVASKFWIGLFIILFINSFEDAILCVLELHARADSSILRLKFFVEKSFGGMCLS